MSEMLVMRMKRESFWLVIFSLVLMLEGSDIV
jgi:uncharacterized membrane protein